MKRLLRVTVFVAVATSSAWAAQFTLILARPMAGQWRAFGQLSNTTDNDGLSSLIVNVGATGGDLAVNSSTAQLPYGTHYWLSGGTQSQLVGFTEFRSNGTGGIGIRAGQKTTSLGQIVLTDVGYSAGSYPGDQTGGGLGPTVISWSAPVLIASGSYSGLYGTLSVAVGAGQVNVLDPNRDPSQAGGVHQIESVVAGQLRIYCPGDATGDDAVDEGDFSVLVGSWRRAGKTWAEGDFTGEGVVNEGDFALLVGNWNWSAPAPAPLAAPIPEPMTAALLAWGAATLFPRRRRGR